VALLRARQTKAVRIAYNPLGVRRLHMTKMKRLVLFPTFLVFCACAAFAQGQVARPRPQRRIITKTRLVAIFSDLENQLFEAVHKKDHAGVDSILSEDFQLWTPRPPGDPVPREDWKNQSLAENLKEFRIRQMAARAVEDNVTLVSFVLSKTVQRATKPSVQDYFVVDLWQKAENKWKLTDRYASPFSGAPSRPVRAQPTGKD
jgi:Domain of unknown function (DUF4440)